MCMRVLTLIVVLLPLVAGHSNYVLQTLEELQNRLSSVETRSDTEVASLKESLTRADTEIDNLKESSTIADTEIANLKESLTTADATIANLGGSLTSADTEIANLKRSLIRAEARSDKALANFKESVTRAYTKIASLQESLSVAETEIENLKGDETVNPIGFSVRTPKSTTKSNQISFKYVISNEGAVFDIVAGEFVCQQSGVYFFSLSIVKSYSYNGYAQCAIEKNGASQVVAFTQPGTSGSQGAYAATNSIYIHLATGDKVTVGWCTSLSSLSGASSFTGFLVKADTA